jgi:hypothetical protein
MLRRLPWLLLLILPLLRFPGLLTGAQVISADDHLSVHHVFQTEPGGRVRHPQLSDPALQFAALRKQVQAALKSGEVPLWNPDIWAGAPLLGDGQSSVGSPVTWLHLLLPEDPAQNLGVLWVMLWTGLGTALLARRLGARSWGASVAGIAAMTGPYTQVWLLHPHAATFAWLPWLLLSLERGAPAWLALATAGLLMGGHPETAAHCLVLVGLWAAGRGHWKTALLGLPIGALLSGPIIGPLGEEVLRSASLQAHGGNQLEWRQLLNLVWPGWHGHPALETWGKVGTWTDGRLHPGIGVLGLVGLGLWHRERRVCCLSAAWVGAILIAVIGMPGPLNHARLGAMGAWLLALAAGLSVRHIAARYRPLATAAVVLTGLYACWPDQGTIDSALHAPSPAPWTQALRAELGCGPSASTPSGCGRVLGLGWAIQPNTGSLGGLRDIRGYDLPVSWETERLQRMLRPNLVRPWFQVDKAPPAELLQVLSVRALAAPEPLPGRPVLQLGPSSLAIHPLSPPAPRAWLATAPVSVVDSDRAAQAWVAEPSRSSPPVVGLTGQWPAQGEVLAAHIVLDGANRVQVQASTPHDAILVLADAWHPGWTATDSLGRAHSILQVGGVFRGVHLSAGDHLIDFSFSPVGWQLGLGAGGLGLLGLLGLILRRRRTT